MCRCKRVSSLLFPRPDHKLKPSCLFIPCSKFEMDFHFANLEVTHDEDDVILRIRSIPESQILTKNSCTWSEIFFLSKPGIARSYSKQMQVNKLRWSCHVLHRGNYPRMLHEFQVYVYLYPVLRFQGVRVANEGGFSRYTYLKKVIFRLVTIASWVGGSHLTLCAASLKSKAWALSRHPPWIPGVWRGERWRFQGCRIRDTPIDDL